VSWDGLEKAGKGGKMRSRGCLWTLILLAASFLLVLCYGRVTTPALTVEEYPIVAAEEDSPDHFEYMDRIGSEILAKRQVWRGHGTEHWLARTNETLAPFGYRLEPRFDEEWNRTFYNLLRDGEAEPMLLGLSQISPVSINASGTDFILTAENAPRILPRHLKVQACGVSEWDAGANLYLPPVYAGDALATVNYTGFPTLTYQVELDGGVVYTGTAAAYGNYMPLRSLTGWDGHWVLAVDDHLILDGEDLAQAKGFDRAFEFAVLHGQPFYFLQQGETVKMSYAGQILPHSYEDVIHNRCCEPAMFNPEANGDMVWFHARKDGIWTYVEAGVYDSAGLWRQ